MKNLDSNYEKLYDLYKKLPVIASILTAVIFFVGAIIFSAYANDSIYGVEVDAAMGYLLIGWLIGAVLSFATWFFSSLVISATVVKTDAIIAIKKHLTKN